MPQSNSEMLEMVEVAGEVYALNDHVYLSAPWNASDGAPWLIGRIMEFIREPMQSAPVSQSSTGNNSMTKKRRKSSLKLPNIIQVKIAHYHRQRDLMSRHIFDCRLLEASMTYDIFSINRLRGKCRVEYKPPGEDVDPLKNAPDCFYFHQVYGRYTHRHYDVISTENVKNAPPEVVQYLRSHYSYVFAEAGMGPELGDERRGCVTCQKWTTGADSVTCALCSRAYHFTCLNPPLTRKPERGYTWACAPCSKQRQDKIEDSLCKGLDAPLSGSGSGRTLRDKGKKKETPVTAVIQTDNEATGTLRTVDGWPFRYYGQYTEPASILDPLDSPFLYTAPRLGPRYQTNVPDDPSAKFVPFVIPANRVGRPCKGEKRARDGTPANLQTLEPEVELTRGGDETVDVISTPEQFVDDPGSESINTLRQYIDQVRSLQLFKTVGVSLLDLALVTHRESGSYMEAFEKIKGLGPKSMGFVNWSESESHRIDQAVQDLGEDMRGMLKHFPKKTSSDIARFYYMFKGHKFPEPSAHDSRVAASTSELPDENMSILPAPSPKRPYLCVVCETRTSTTWRRCPDALMAGATQAKKCICDDCHSRWRRYGLHHVPVAEQEDSKPKERKIRVPKLNKGPVVKTSTAGNSPAASSAPSPPPPPRAPPPPPPLPASLPLSLPAPLPSPPPVSFKAASKISNCVLCRQIEPCAELAQCQNCTLSCHRACGGLEQDADLQNWSCLLCKSVGSKSLPKIPSCSLCPGGQSVNSSDDTLTALDIWKVSEYNTFVHMLCALWHPELIFSESSNYEKVEGFTTIPPNKRRRDCDICQRSNVGACVKCDGCSKHIHVSCAWTAGYKFGFEMAPPRRKRNRELEFVKFKDQEGILEPKLWCPAHFPGPGRIIYGLADRDEATNLTVVQTYATNFKTTGPAPGIAILRKARRLDAVLASVLTTKGILSTDNVGKRSDLKDEYMVSALGVLPPTSSVPPPVVEPTLMAPPRQRRPSGNQAGESAPRGKPRAKARVGRVRVRSKGKARARGASRTDSITQEPSKENAVGEVADDDEDQEEEAQEDNAHMSRSTDAEQRSATNNSPRVVNDQNSHQTISLQPSYTSMVSLAPVASSSRPRPIGASSEIFDGPRRLGKPSQAPPVLSLQSANLANSLPKSPRVEQQISSGDLRSRQFTVSQSTQPQQIVPSPAIATPRVPTLQKTNKLRLTIKPAAPSSIPLVRPTLEPELVPKEPVRISSTAAFPFVSTSNPAAYMSHMPRPMSSASSCSSSSSKPHVTRLPSINQLDSFHSTMPGLHRLAPLPPMNISTSSPSGIDPQGKSAAPLGSTSFRHPSLANSVQHASNPTPIHPIRGTAPLLNPPSFDAFAAAAAAHTTKSANNKVAGAQPGSSVSPDSPHRNLELNAARLLNKAIHLS